MSHEKFQQEKRRGDRRNDGLKMVEEHLDVGWAKIEGNALVLSAIIFMTVCGCNWCLWIVLYNTNSLALLLKTIVHSNINIYSRGIEIWQTSYQIKLK